MRAVAGFVGPLILVADESVLFHLRWFAEGCQQVLDFGRSGHIGGLLENQQ
jgi:hypothetical protein